MMRADISLGSVDLASTASDLDLHLESRAQLASSADNAESICDRLTGTVLTSCDSNNLWITRGNDFKLIISLNVTGDDLDIDRLTRAFAHNLHHAELWKELHLQADSIEITGDVAAENDVIILRLSRETVSLSSRLHKLAEGVPFDDIRPPDRVYEVNMDAVHLFMQVKPQTRTKRRKCEVRESEDGSTAEQALHSMIANPLQSDKARHYVRADPELQDGDMLSDAGENDLAISVGLDQTGHTSLKRMASTAIMSQSSTFDAEQAVLELLDAGLRHSIAASPKRKTKGVYVSGSEAFRPLAEIAPALWSPGYQLAVSRRAVLIPTVGHALSRIGIVSAHRMTLRTKMEELSRRSGGLRQLGSHQGRQPRSSQSDPSCIAQSLWHLAQHALLDSEAACRLKSTVTSETTGDDRGHEDYPENDILDGDCDVMSQDLMLDDHDHGQDEIRLLEDTYWNVTVPQTRRCLKSHSKSSNPARSSDNDVAQLPTPDIEIEDDMLSVCDSIGSVRLLPTVDHNYDVMDRSRPDWCSDLDFCVDSEAQLEEMLLTD